MNWTDFFHMGGYAFHVWTSWGLGLLVLLYLFIQAKLANAKLRRDIARQIRRENKLSPPSKLSANSSDN